MSDNTNTNTNTNTELELSKEQASESRLWTVASYFSGMISTTLGGTDKTEIEKWDTGLIDGSLCNRLNSVDKYLDRISSTRKIVQSEYDKIVIETKNIKSKYTNNLEMINKKVDDIRTEVNDFINKILALNLQSPGEKLTEEEKEKDNEKTLETINQIFDFTEKLKYKIGNNGSGLFKHIDIQGVQTLSDYYKAIELNKKILVDVASSYEKEQPLKKKLIEIDAIISKVTREIDLIKQFNIEHTKIITEDNGPVISGAPKQMLN